MEFNPMELGVIFTGAGRTGGNNCVFAWRLREKIKALEGANVEERSQMLTWIPDKTKDSYEIELERDDHDRVLTCAINWAFVEPTPRKIDLVYVMAKKLNVEHQFEKAMKDGGFIEKEEDSG